MARTPSQTAWDVSLKGDRRETFTRWLCQELVQAEAARMTSVPEVRYWWRLYEQGRTRETQPYQDAADLTSYFPCEKTDALHARIMRTVMVDPVWTVEGWGDSAAKAPFVEDFHQWQQEVEGLQRYLSRAMLLALVEPRAVLEIYEDSTERVVRKEIQAKIVLTPDQQFMLDQDLQPVLERDEAGNFIEVTDDDPQGGSARTVIDDREVVRKGPGYRVLAYDQFLILPGHAREKSDIWGYAKRVTKRVDQLKEAVQAGVYDKTAVDDLTESPDVTSETTLSGEAIPIAPQQGPTAEKELWEVQLLHDLGDGLRWYIATVQKDQQILLRLKHDDIGRGRYVVFIPYPRADRVTEGYSFVGHKLITVTEEHTAWRNAIADRTMMELSGPIKRLTGALWDPDDQPFGPKAVIDVRDMNEVQPMDMPRLTTSAWNREQEIIQAAERVAGMNDVAIGQTPQQNRTLGEVNIVAEQSFVRMDNVIKQVQESLEELGHVRHAIWVRVLQERGAEGMSAPQSLLAGLEGRSGDASSSVVTVDMLQGVFRFKPRGSTENADLSRLRGDWINFLQALGILVKIWPGMMQVIGMNQEAAKSALENTLRLFRVPDKQAWLGPMGQPGALMPPQMGMPGAGPGMPPGMPPGPGGPPGMMPSGAGPGVPPIPPQLLMALLQRMGPSGPPQG